MAIEPIKLPSIHQNIAAPAGSNPQDVQLAKDQLAMTYAPQEMGINTAIDFINQNLSRDVSAQQNYGQIADQKIGQIGADLANTLQGNVGKVSDIYKQGTAEVGNAYDQAMNTLQGIGQSVQAPIKQGMANYGIQQDQFGRDPLSRLQGDLAVYQSRTAAGKAAATSNLTTLGTQLTAIAQKAVGDSVKDYAQKRTDVATQVLKTIGQLQSTANLGVMEQLQKFSVLAETAGPMFRTLLSQATSARNEAERQNAKDQLDYMIKMSDMQDKALSRAEKNDPNSLDNISKRLGIEKSVLELEDLQTRPKYISDAEGQSNLMSWLNANVRKDRKSPGLSGTEHAGIQNFIKQNIPQTVLSGIYNTEDPAAILRSLAYQNVDPKTGKVNLPVTSGSKYKQSDYQTDPETLLEALIARFQNVGSAAKIGTKI